MQFLPDFFLTFSKRFSVIRIEKYFFKKECCFRGNERFCTGRVKIFVFDIFTLNVLLNYFHLCVLPNTNDANARYSVNFCCISTIDKALTAVAKVPEEVVLV